MVVAKTKDAMTTFPYLAIGDLFLWKDETWIKMRHGKAKKTSGGKAMAFGFTNPIQRVAEKPIWFFEYPAVLNQLNALLRPHGVTLRCRSRDSGDYVYGRIEKLKNKEA